MISNEELKSLKPGDRVRIVREWTGVNQALDGSMDHWLGKIMTVKYGIKNNAVRMVEDEGERSFASVDYSGWFWYQDMIDEIIDEAAESAAPLSMDEIALLYA